MRSALSPDADVACNDGHSQSCCDDHRHRDVDAGGHLEGCQAVGTIVQVAGCRWGWGLLRHAAGEVAVRLYVSRDRSDWGLSGA